MLETLVENQLPTEQTQRAPDETIGIVFKWIKISENILVCRLKYYRICAHRWYTTDDVVGLVMFSFNVDPRLAKKIHVWCGIIIIRRRCQGHTAKRRHLLVHVYSASNSVGGIKHMPTKLKIIFCRIHKRYIYLRGSDPLTINQANPFHNSHILMAEEEKIKGKYVLNLILFFVFHFISFIPNIFNTSKRSVQNNFLSIQHI